MEYLNKIEIRGIVGQVSFAEVGDKKHANFYVCTHRFYKNKNGEAVFDTTWFNVSAWEGPKNGIDNLQKGDFVGVTGRLRIQKYATSEGTESSVPEVVATSVTLIQSAEE